MGVRIRLGREDDWRSVARGNAETAWLTFGTLGSTRVPAALFRRRARRYELGMRRESSPRRALFVAEDERGYAGHVWLEERGDPWSLERYTVILTLFVARRARRRGIGRRLLRRAYRWGNQHGHARVQLSVGTANPGAVALYRSEGFETFLVTQSRRLA